MLQNRTIRPQATIGPQPQSFVQGSPGILDPLYQAPYPHSNILGQQPKLSQSAYLNSIRNSSTCLMQVIWAESSRSFRILQPIFASSKISSHGCETRQTEQRTCIIGSNTHLQHTQMAHTSSKPVRVDMAKHKGWHHTHLTPPLTLFFSNNSTQSTIPSTLARQHAPLHNAPDHLRTPSPPSSSPPAAPRASHGPTRNAAPGSMAASPS